MFHYLFIGMIGMMILPGNVIKYEIRYAVINAFYAVITVRYAVINLLYTVITVRYTVITTA